MAGGSPDDGEPGRASGCSLDRRTMWAVSRTARCSTRASECRASRQRRCDTTEQFLRKCEVLGFNRNSPAISLMPLLAFVDAGHV